MIRVNLLPEAQKTKATKKTKVKREIPLTWIIAGLVVVLITCVGLGLFHLNLQRNADAIQADIITYKEEVKKLRLDVQKVDQVKAQRAELNNKLAVIDKLKSAQKGPVHLLDQLASAIPQRVWVTKMSENGASMSLEGMALEHHQISRFMKNLEKSPFFSNVELSGTESSTSTSGRRGEPLSAESVKSFSLTLSIEFPKDLM